MAGRVRHNRFLSVAKVDPSRTTTIRNAFIREVNARFSVIQYAIKHAIVDQDCFGLSPVSLAFSKEEAVKKINVGRGQFAFNRTSDKVDAFMKWIDEQTKSNILEMTTRPGTVRGIESAWTDKFIQSAYQKGIIRARSELRKLDSSIPAVEKGDEEAVSAIFNQPMHLDRVGVLFTRTFNELKGVTDAMSQAISRELATGLMQGKSPLDIARTLNKQVKNIGINRARTIARTEVIRAHHMANIQEYRNAGLAGVKVIAEWETAGFNVCPICASLEGKKFTLDEIEDLIPAHPNCLVDGQVKIYTSNGWRSIRNVAVGDLVLTHKGRFRKVIRVHRNIDRPEIVKFELKNRMEELSVTAQHPVLVNNQWMSATDVRVTDLFRYCEVDDSKNNVVCNFLDEGIGKITKWKSKYPIMLYNLSVEEDESYIAKGFVVHNCRCVAVPYRQEWDLLKASPGDVPPKGVSTVHGCGGTVPLCPVFSPPTKDMLAEGLNNWVNAKQVFDSVVKERLVAPDMNDPKIVKKFLEAKQIEKKARRAYVATAPEDVYIKEREKLLDDIFTVEGSEDKKFWELPKGLRDEITAGTNWIPYDVLDELVDNGYTARVVDEGPVSFFRSYFAEELKEVYVSVNSKYETVAHEMSHAVDQLFCKITNPSLTEPTTGLRWHGVKGPFNKTTSKTLAKEYKSLHGTEKIKRGTDTYLKGKFIHEYEGRVYEGKGDGVGVEWWSMNCQRYAKYEWSLKEFDKRLAKAKERYMTSAEWNGLDDPTTILLKQAVDELKKEGREAWAASVSQWKKVREYYPKLSRVIEQNFGSDKRFVLPKVSITDKDLELLKELKPMKGPTKK